MEEISDVNDRMTCEESSGECKDNFADDTVLDPEPTSTDQLTELFTKENFTELFEQVKLNLKRFWEYLQNIEMKDDTKMSLAIGIIAGICILVYLAYNPGEPTADYSDMSASARAMNRNEESEKPNENGATKEQSNSQASKKKKKKKKKTNTGNLSDEKHKPEEQEGDESEQNDDEEEEEPKRVTSTKMKEIDEEVWMQKGKKFQKVFGLTDEQMRQAVRDTNEEIRTGKSPVEYEESPARSVGRWIDRIVIGGALALLIYYTNRDYNGIVTHYFKMLFPKEADTLGIE